MVAATLGIEITISGFLYVLGIIILFLPPHATDLKNDLIASKDYLPYISAAIVGASYLMGLAAPRTFAWICQHLPKSVRTFLGNLGSERNPDDLALIWQCGSARMQSEMDYQFGLLLFIRSFLISIPFVALTSTYYVRTLKNDWRLTIVAWFVSWLLCWPAYFRQRCLYLSTQKAVIGILRAPRSPSQRGHA
jgi:membrane protease YdiL (CAAX protease family)